MTFLQVLLSITSSWAQHKNNSEGEENVAASFGLKVSERLQRKRQTKLTEIIGEDKEVVTVQALLLTPCHTFLLAEGCALGSAAHPWVLGGLMGVCRVLWVRREGIIYCCRDWRLPDVIITCSDGGYFC